MVQETLERAFKGVAKYRGGSEEAERLGWLKKIFKNYTIDWIRKENNHGNDPALEQTIGEAVDESFRLVQNLASPDSTPSHKAQRKEEDARTRDALQRLTEKERRVIELHLYQGLTIKDTAEQLGLKSPRAASGVFARGLVRLREILDSDA
jgi:RNA polymerase sigma factor (sigma-70 family)